jgi:hypothetical protein
VGRRYGLRMRSAAPLFACCLLSACGPSPQPAVDAAERARPYVAQFERFERWVTRASDGSAVLRREAALSEAMFAPLRRAEGVLGAWVHLPGRPMLDLALPSSSAEPSLQGATRVHDVAEEVSLLRARARGELWVLVQRPCALAASEQDTPGPDECVLLAREARTALGPMRVVAAFR